jgi:Lar family restriction alleviation protein
MTNDKPTLLPCPFCGGKASYTRAVNGSQMHYAGCGACGIAFKAQEVREVDPTRDHLTKDIVAAWNRRAVPPTLPGPR